MTSYEKGQKVKTLEYWIPEGSSEIDKMHQTARFKRQDLNLLAVYNVNGIILRRRKKNCYSLLIVFENIP